MEETVRKIGPYNLLSQIGHGTFGVVWLAERRASLSTTRVALKLPRSEDVDLETFRREADIWMQASGHTNVLPLIEAEVYDGQIAIVSEYAPDGSLEAWRARHGGRAPSVDKACEMMEGVLEGLAHLHARRIIIPHPDKGTIDVTAPMPPHMRQSWNLIGFDDASGEEE